MTVCGIEFKSDELIAVILANGEMSSSLKLSLKDDELQASVKKFVQAWQDFLSQAQPNKILIKKRSKKGRFAGGPLSFKMEALVQISSEMEVSLVSSAKISAVQKKNAQTLPPTLKKYQEQAFWTASC